MVTVRYSSVVAVALAMAASACADRAPVAPSATVVGLSVSGAARSMLHAARPGVEGHFLRIAASLPSFAGVALDSSDNTRGFVYVTRPADAQQALAAARALFDERERRTPALAAPTLSVVGAEHRFADLAAWRDVVSNHADLPGVHTWAIDIRNNRIFVGVREPPQVASVRAALAAYGIPAAALDVRASPAPVLSATLQDRFPAAVPGIKITTSNGAACSLGLNAYSPAGSRVFFTASHCTPVWLGPDGTSFAQPTFGFGTTGTETLDPEGIYGDGANGCPSGYYCRWSDVAVVSYDASAPWKFSWIAKPSTGTTFGDYAPIVGAEEDPYQGQWVARVGMTSGYARGTVEYPSTGVTDLRNGRRGAVMDATMVTGASAMEGDSGGPVFVDPTIYAPPGRPLIAGVEFARNPAGSAFYYSSLSSIYADMGYGWVVHGVTVRLTGPSTISLPGTYTWTATALGGGSLNYQWERSSSETSGWYPVGGNAATYSEYLDWVKPGTNTSFYLRVTANAGTELGQSATSEPFRVLVYRP